ncbi:methyl-accepting chemotaxis protein [Paenibacillus cymbidii]|uniref:methyl-accepting chemotaxis protein n=1 Tax=Paenibacillus cymbidii TaxID=1639034 RepID=UPI0010802C2F|nr:methyl-accepting chemotaxis protein [Paenibacillus cymbidii]
MKWYTNLKTATKLVSAFILVALILAATGMYALSNLSNMNGRMKVLYNNNLISVRDLSAAEISYQKMRVTLRDLSIASTKTETDTLALDIPVAKKEIEDKFNSYRNTTLTKAEKDELKVFDAEYAAYVKLYDTAAQLAVRDDQTEFNTYKNDTLNPQGAKMRDSMERLIAINVQLAEDANQDAAHSYSRSRNATIAVIVGALLFSILLGYAISQSIARPLNRIVGLVAKVAEGDLREKSPIVTKDEIGALAASVNHMIDNLSNLVGGIAQSSQSVAAASEQISASSEEIASGSTSQARSAQNISELFGELSKAINFVARSAEEAAELSTSTVQTASEGSKIVEGAVAGMKSVSTSMSRLEEDSNKIGEIIEVIDDIADQTNLLALNAAIEAARAGDQGRGFAVVADEVRKLAERSSAATKEISTIIKAMQQNTKLSVTSFNESMTQSMQTGEAFRLITGMVNDSANKVSEIAAACEEEAAQASEVMQSVELVASASEESAAASEETAATCQSLAQLADELNVSVSVFKLGSVKN